MRFIVATDSKDIDDRGRDIITAVLEGKGWSVWHWFKDLWLVDGAPDDLNPTELRQEIKDLLPADFHMMLMSTEGRKWHSGRVPSAATTWINEHWMADEKKATPS